MTGLVESTPMYVEILPGSPSSVVSSASGFVTTIEVSGVTKLYCKKIWRKIAHTSIQ